MSDLTKEEQNVINSLKRLAKRWPQSLTLWSGCSNLYVMRTDKFRKKEDTGFDVYANPEAVVTQINGIPNDGGGW